MPANRRNLVATALGVLLLAGCAKSCQKTAGPAAAKDDLALAPRETDIAFMANLTRVRASSLWKKLLDLRDKDPAAKKQYDDFVQKCHFDPLSQIDSIFLALPQNSADTREFAIIARGNFGQDNLVGCVKATAKENSGKEVVETDYQGHKLYSVTGQDGSITLLSKKIAVLAGKDWVKRVIDLYDNRTPGGGAKDHKELMDLIHGTRTGDALWGAGLVPPSVGEKLRQNPQLGAAATMKSVYGSIDFQKGLLIHLNLDLATDKDATELAGRITEQLAGARKEPKVQMMGLSSYFDTVKVEARASTFTALIDLNQQQVDDLTTRLQGLLKGLGLGMRPAFEPPPAPESPPAP